MDPTMQNPAVETSTPPTEGPPANGDRRVSVLVMALVAGAALVLGGIVGVAIGWKVEQNRVKEDVKNVRPVGTITAVTDDSITVNLRTGSGRRTYALTDATVIDKAESGATSDIKEGSTVFLRTRRGDNGELEAAQVIVLPEEVPATDN
jgi:hypothetical protein